MSKGLWSVVVTLSILFFIALAPSRSSSAEISRVSVQSDDSRWAEPLMCRKLSCGAVELAAAGGTHQTDTSPSTGGGAHPQVLGTTGSGQGTGKPPIRPIADPLNCGCNCGCVANAMFSSKHHALAWARAYYGRCGCGG